MGYGVSQRDPWRETPFPQSRIPGSIAIFNKASCLSVYRNGTASHSDNSEPNACVAPVTPYPRVFPLVLNDCQGTPQKDRTERIEGAAPRFPALTGISLVQPQWPPQERMWLDPFLASAVPFQGQMDVKLETVMEKARSRKLEEHPAFRA